MEYKPPFSINDDIINLLAKTSELVGQVSILHKSSSLKLRRENRIKTIVVLEMAVSVFLTEIT